LINLSTDMNIFGVLESEQIADEPNL